MSRTRKFFLLCSATLVLLFFSGPAYAASYLDEAVQALQSGNVYVSLESSGIDSIAKQELVAQTAGSDVAVVVLPANALNETGGDSAKFIQEIAQRSGYDTIVVAFGNNLEAGSSELASGAAQQLADEAEASGQSLEDSLLTFVTEVRQEQPSAPSPNAGSESGGMGLVLVIVCIVVAIGVAASVAWAKLRHRTSAQALPELTTAGELRAPLENMRQLALQIRSDAALSESVMIAATETDELFVEIRKVLPDRVHEKTAEFLNHVNRVNRVLGMYIKAQDKPRHFKDATEVQSATRSSILSYGENVHRNLIAVGESELLDFEVDVAMLTQPTIRPQLEK